MHDRALKRAMVICGILVTGVFYLWNMFPIPVAYTSSVLLLVTLFVVALITVIVYQSSKIHESAEVMAQHITKDMLLYSRELFSELYRSSPVPYLVINDEGSIESINFAAARLFRVEQNALEGLSAFSFFVDDPKNPNIKASLIPEYFKEGKFVNDVEVQIRCPDTSLKWTMLSLFSFVDSEGAKKGLLTLVDITKQKLVDKAKTEFVSLASHQLRTPISGIKWNLELLHTAGTNTLSPAQQVYVDKIQSGVERMEILVNDFLSVSKFELGTLTPEFSVIELKPFFQGVLDEHTPFAAQKNIRLEIAWSPLSTLRTDAHLLHMITNNLLSNAVKYTPKDGAVRFAVTDATNTLTIQMTDTGIGIPQEDQEMLFSKMFRASNARTLVTDGTGLGLYIVKEAARILGGQITFESKEGQGTTFTVVLPK